jgi:hypothetical protein
MPMIGTPAPGTDPVLAVGQCTARIYTARLDYETGPCFDTGYWSTCRQDGHRATATPTPMETTTSKVSVSPMRKRRID